MKNLSLRIPEEVVDETKILIKYEHLEQSVILREALKIGLDELKKKTAIELFSEGKITISEAASIAGVSVGEMMEILTKLGIKSGIELKDVKNSLKNALKSIN